MSLTAYPCLFRGAFPHLTQLNIILKLVCYNVVIKTPSGFKRWVMVLKGDGSIMHKDIYREQSFNI